MLVHDFDNLVDAEGFAISNLEGTSTMPHAFSHCRRLQRLKLTWSNITGTIPPLDNCAQLHELDFSGNQLTGQIPWDMLGSLAQNYSLRVLRLGVNSFEASTIPDNMGVLLSKVEVLDLASIGFGGEIPALDLCVSLRVLDLSYNALCGQLPDFSRCQNLQEL